MNTLEQARALLCVPKPSTKHQLDELIRGYMAKYFGWYGSGEWVDKPFEAEDFDSNGSATGPGKWRALRRFAVEASEILNQENKQ